ncbi:hypothetical protein ACFQT0_24800 [Hymenobacter humi]|uniref:Uncharacterized protein n=1 Tax=Hymenobacter humi TaxID=1411620 RepID=A0ABW2U9N9_9BACT
MLTVLFTIYDSKAAPNNIQPEAAVQGGLFAPSAPIETSEALAARVWDGLLKTMDAEARTRLFHVFLSEQPDREPAHFPVRRLGPAHPSGHLDQLRRRQRAPRAAPCPADVPRKASHGSLRAL